MEAKKFTQFGTFSVITLLSVFILTVIFLFLGGLDNPTERLVFVIVPLTFFICLLIFYKLTISIDSTTLSFRMGLGFVRRKYPISDIESCSPVKNSMMYGIGIRKIPGGWLYNVTGLDAIEITFKSSNSVIRIGTDKAEEISGIISKMIQKDKFGIAFDEKKSSGQVYFAVLISLIVIIPAILLFSGKKDSEVLTSENEISIKGMYGLTIKRQDILQLDTISNLPSIRLKTNGYAFGKTMKGNFTTSDRNKVKLFVTRGVPPYIHIVTKDLSVYLNFRDSNKTIDLFDRLKSNQK
jgi:hypothetical protein